MSWLRRGRPASPPIPQLPERSKDGGALGTSAQEMAEDGASLDRRRLAEEEAEEEVGGGVLAISHRLRD
jgi:hypothetical protein